MIPILDECELRQMWQANDATARIREPGYLRRDYDSHRRGLLRERPDATEQQLREQMFRRVMGERQKWRQAFIAARGPRYAECRLSNFEAETEMKKQAVERLRAYGVDLADNVANGRGIILFGPKGTGKDHLVSALAQYAIITHGADVEWVNGMDLFGRFRDVMDTQVSERSVVESLVNRQVLYISDPVPPTGVLTDYQATTLFRVLDGRYSRCRPTWITANVTSAQELDSRIGAQNGDRLRDGAVAVFCNWPSHRKAQM